MNIVYIAPMFHTNQMPIVKGWVEHGDQVCFICQYRGKTEIMITARLSSWAIPACFF